MKILRDYLRLSLFCFCLLLGIQIPAFVDQYGKRVDAHLIEARQALAGFQVTADKYFAGSLARLLSHYKSSNDVVFQHDATNIAFIIDRVSLLEAEQVAMQKMAVWQTWHVLTASDKQVRQETQDNFSYVIPLNPQALVWGLSAAVLLAIVCDTLLACLGLLFFRRSRANPPASP